MSLAAIVLKTLVASVCNCFMSPFRASFITFSRLKSVVEGGSDAFTFFDTGVVGARVVSVAAGADSPGAALFLGSGVVWAALFWAAPCKQTVGTMLYKLDTYI